MSLVRFAQGDRVEPLDGAFRGTVVKVEARGHVIVVHVVLDATRDAKAKLRRSLANASEQDILRYPADSLRRIDVVGLLAELDE